MTNIDKLLALKWNFYVSRNIQAWHNSLQMCFGSNGLKHYKLPKLYWQIRIARNVNSDFYCLVDKKYGTETVTKPLSNLLLQKKYIIFLKKEYKKDCKKLLKHSLKLKPSYSSLNKFFSFYGYCTILLDITALASKILTDKIASELKNYPDFSEIISFYGTPKKLAPFQKLEKEVQILKSKKNLNLKSEASKLCKKYNWIPVSFVAEPWDEEYFLNLLKKSSSKKISNKISLPKTKIPRLIKHDLFALSEITYLNEYRKAIFSQVNLNIRPILQKIAIDNGYNNWTEMSLLTHEEILDILKGKNLKQTIQKRLTKPFAILKTNQKNCQIIYGSDVEKFENKFKEKYINVKEFKGTIGNKGKVKGIVRVVFGPQDFHKFSEGEIIVAKMTSVDYMPIMKKAAAFVTDEGGLACHAAVVSREFGLPCIIGTKIATAVLRDGDMIEVDANSGIVKIL